jgi:hypothetical protein
LVCGNGETREVKEEDERERETHTHTHTHTHTKRERESDKTRRGAIFFFDLRIRGLRLDGELLYSARRSNSRTQAQEEAEEAEPLRTRWILSAGEWKLDPQESGAQELAR